MKADIYSHTHLIGTTELIPGDISMGGVYGLFTPNKAFDEHVRWAFKKHWLTGRPKIKTWGALKLSVQLENGYFIYAAGGITLTEDEGDLFQIDMAGVDADAIRDFILAVPPRLFIEEPWETISIEQKIAFEDELHKELGTNSPFKSKHPLQGFGLEALCRYGRNDDVLFTTRHPDSKNQFAVIHLTWLGGRELEGYPWIEFFEDFDGFRVLRMFPDKGLDGATIYL